MKYRLAPSEADTRVPLERFCTSSDPNPVRSSLSTFSILKYDNPLIKSKFELRNGTDVHVQPLGSTKIDIVFVAD